jgi:hypothetical protein
MNLQTKSIAEKVTTAQAAMNSGLLKNYMPVTSINESTSAQELATKSWGSAMRR